MPVVYHQKDASYRVFLDSRQGGRKYMEDVVCVREMGPEEGKNGFVYFGVFDGHGGASAARFAREHLLDEIKKQKGFWTDDQEQVSRAIKDAFISTHRLMWKNVGRWPKTLSGLPSTAGTTASIVVIKDSKLYVAHVGDSAVVIGEKYSQFKQVRTVCPTVDHKPESPIEKKRIEESGGQVMAKSGVQRVVWHRPKPNHKGPVRRSTHIDDIPFLAVARALGDLWSYNSQKDTFVVSPEPDISVYDFDPIRQRFIVLGSDGLWNMVKAEDATALMEKMEEQGPHPFNLSVNPARRLVQLALDKWGHRNLRADNTSVIAVTVDPPREDDNLSRCSSRVSSSSTVRLSEADTDILSDYDLDLGAAVELSPNGVENSPALKHGLHWNIAPSPRNIGLCRKNAIHAKHLHMLNGKTPPRASSFWKPRLPSSAPSKLHSSTSFISKFPSLAKSPSAPVSGSCDAPRESAASFSDISDNAILTSIRSKPSPSASLEICKITPLQASESPLKKRKLSLESCESPSSNKRLKHSDSSNGETNDDQKTDGCDPGFRGPRSTGSHSPHVLASDCPKVATSARSPLKVDTCNHNSPSMALVSPIWPSCLDKDLDMDQSSADNLCNLPVSSSEQSACVLQEEKVSSKLTNFTSIRTSNIRKQKKSGATKPTNRIVRVVRKSTQGHRLNVKRLNIRSKRPIKLRNSVHRTRLQVKASLARAR